MAESKQYITQNQENGTVQISEDVIISIVTVAVGETEGVAGFSARLGSDIAESSPSPRMTVCLLSVTSWPPTAMPW